MKKFLCVFLSLIMMLSLAACAEKKAEPETVEEPVVSVSAEEPEVVEKPDPAVEANDVFALLDKRNSESASKEKTEAKTEEPEKEIVYPEASLKDIFAEHGIKCGTCMTTRMLGDATYKAIIDSQFNSATMENEMKPDSILNKAKSIETGELEVEFKQDALSMMEYAKEHGMALRGHTLIWYSQTPNWIFYEDFDPSKELVTREVMLDRMEKYMENVFGTLEELGYIDLFYAYDVANEAILDNGSLRDNNWKATIGDDYLWYAFYYADKYAPEYIDLYYNDFNEQFKYTSTIKMVDTLKDTDGRSLIDGIGLQAHLYTKDDQLLYFQALDAYAKTGLKVQLTELDVCLGSYQMKLNNTDENLAAQGRWYYNLIEGILKRKDEGTLNIDAITFWGFADNLSWRSSQYPVLYTFKGVPKPAYFGAAQMREYAGFSN